MPTESYKQTIDPETDPDRVVAWWMVDSVDLIRIYYQQHLGPSFTDIPAIEIPRPEYIALLDGEDAILADVFEYSPQLLDDIALIYTRSSQDAVKVAMNLESEACGQRIIEFLEGHTNYALHNKFRRGLENLAERVQVHHYTWQRDRPSLPPFGLHRILIPKASRARMDQTRKQAAEAEQSAVSEDGENCEPS
jgi:hypothetical protein